MPYSLISDTLGRDPRWLTLAGGKLAIGDALLAAFVRLQSESASHQHDGYLTRSQALDGCHGRARTVELLCTSVLGGRPFLHRPGEACAERNCLDGSGPWVEGFAYRICGFSKRNPSRGEHDRNKSQKADSRDPRLREMVYDRDGGCCRYCRSGPLRKKGMGRAKDRRRALQFDHVDPDQSAGADGGNYVVTCGRCNESKGHRTPEEADMVLLPEPTDAQRAAWADRGERLFDRATAGTDPRADNDNDNAPDNARDNARDNTPDNAPPAVADACPDDSPAGAVRPDNPAQAQQQRTGMSPEGSGSGRVGHRDVSPVPSQVSDPAGQPARSPDSPDIYHRRSRAPATATRSTDSPPTPPPELSDEDEYAEYLAEDQTAQCPHGEQLVDPDRGLPDCVLCQHAAAIGGDPP